MLNEKFPYPQERVRELFVNTVTPASAVYENERQLSQRILLLAAFRTATARIRGAATGSAAIGKFLYVHPNNIRIHHGTCSNLLPTTAFHLRNKAYTYTVNLSGGHLFRRSNPILIGSDCVIKVPMPSIFTVLPEAI